MNEARQFARTAGVPAARRGASRGAAIRGCLGHRFSRRSGLAGALAVALSRRDASALDGGTATVVATPELALRASPEPFSEAVGSAPLGALVATSGERIAGYTWVEYEDAAGYAHSLFLAPDLAMPPSFVEGDAGCQRIALIFNVGVGDEPASGIIDTLEAEAVPATMFLMGWWAEQHPAILDRMVAGGFPIGSHGYASTELTLRTDAEVVADIHAAAEAIEHATGVPVEPFFTPYAAAIDERVAAIVASEGYLPVGWRLPANDYGADATAEAVSARVLGGAYDGAIVELHLDGPASAVSTGEALPWIIASLREQGYQFVTIPEMILGCH